MAPDLSPGERGVTPAVSKLLELGVVVLFVGLLTTLLLGGVVPDYRTAVSAEVGERVLVTASQEIERAVPPVTRTVRSTRAVALPPTIHDAAYVIRVEDDHLVLDHPRAEVGGRVRLSLPPSVRRVEGRWQSGARTVVEVRGDADGLVVTLESGSDRQ